MPAKYEAIKAKFKSKGLSDKSAKTHAAKIFNATRKRGEKPVTNHYDIGKAMLGDE